MLNFGKSSKDSKGLVGRRKFDRLVQVSKRTSAAAPTLSWRDDFGYFDNLLAIDQERNEHKVDAMFSFGAAEEVDSRLFVWEEMYDTKQKRDAKNKVWRHTKSRKRHQQSWKNTRSVWTNKEKHLRNNPKVAAQWARHKPKFHCAWTIGEETSATFLVWQCDYEEWCLTIAAIEARAPNYIEEILELETTAQRITYWETVAGIEELEARYECGEWCLKWRDDIQNYYDLINADFERDLLYGFGNWCTRNESVEENTRAWTQAMA